MIASSSGEDNYPYITALTIQEALEMLGVILFIHALLDHLQSFATTVDVELAPEPVAAS